MQVTHVPEEETKAWARGSGVPEALGVRGYLCLLGNLGSSLKHFGAHAGVAPRREQSFSSVCLHCGAWDPPAQKHQLGRLFGWARTPKPNLLPDPRGQRAEVGCLFSLGQVNGWDMTMVTHDQARKRLTKRSEEVVRLLVTRQSLQKAVQQSMLS